MEIRSARSVVMIASQRPHCTHTCTLELIFTTSLAAVTRSLATLGGRGKWNRGSWNAAIGSPAVGTAAIGTAAVDTQDLGGSWAYPGGILGVTGVSWGSLGYPGGVLGVNSGSILCNFGSFSFLKRGADNIQLAHPKSRTQIGWYPRLPPGCPRLLQGYPRLPPGYPRGLQTCCTERSTHTCARVPADLAPAPVGGGKVGGGSGEGFYKVLHEET